MRMALTYENFPHEPDPDEPSKCKLCGELKAYTDTWDMHGPCLAKVSRYVVALEERVYKSPSEVCRDHHTQNCHACESLACGDNTNDNAVLFREVIEHLNDLIATGLACFEDNKPWLPPKLTRVHLNCLLGVQARLRKSGHLHVDTTPEKVGKQELSQALGRLLELYIADKREGGENDTLIARALGLWPEDLSYAEACARYTSEES
jgi:hypothetical protein